MQSLIQNFGIQWYYLAAQIVNFLIIFYLLKRFAYKPILDMLEKRRKTIEEGQKNAEKSEKALLEATEKEKQILRTAQTESQKILADANKQATVTVSEAHESGRKQVEKLLFEAKEQIAKDREQTEKQLAVHVAEMAIDILKRALPNLIDETEQKKVLEKVAKELKKK